MQARMPRSPTTIDDDGGGDDDDDDGDDDDGDAEAAAKVSEGPSNSMQTLLCWAIVSTNTPK